MYIACNVYNIFLINDEEMIKTVDISSQDKKQQKNIEEKWFLNQRNIDQQWNSSVRDADYESTV